MKDPLHHSVVLQRFANNDHLVIHQQKHELSLKLGSKTGEVLLVGKYVWIGISTV